jgi:hypothetical protein
VLPQVLAGLGALSIASAGCIVWLEHYQPAFAVTAALALSYQSWLVVRRPRARRTRAMVLTLAGSLTVTAAVLGIWVVIWLRYW